METVEVRQIMKFVRKMTLRERAMFMLRLLILTNPKRAESIIVGVQRRETVQDALQAAQEGGDQWPR